MLDLLIEKRPDDTELTELKSHWKMENAV